MIEVSAWLPGAVDVFKDVLGPELLGSCLSSLLCVREYLGETTTTAPPLSLHRPSTVVTSACQGIHSTVPARPFTSLIFCPLFVFVACHWSNRKLHLPPNLYRLLCSRLFYSYALCASFPRQGSCKSCPDSLASVCPHPRWLFPFPARLCLRSISLGMHAVTVTPNP